MLIFNGPSVDGFRSERVERTNRYFGSFESFGTKTINDRQPRYFFGSLVMHLMIATRRGRETHGDEKQAVPSATSTCIRLRVLRVWKLRGRLARGLEEATRASGEVDSPALLGVGSSASHPSARALTPDGKESDGT